MTTARLLTATEDSTGKTAMTLALGLLAQDRDRSVGYMKPKGTRLRSRAGKTLDPDPMLARELLGTDDEVHEMEPVVYSPTFIEGAMRGQQDPDELADVVRERYETIATDRDQVFIEGTCYTTGGVVDLTDPEIAELLDAEVVVVAEYTQPGDIDDVLATVDAVGDRLTGVVFNRVTDEAYDTIETDVAPFLEAADIPVLGMVPRERDLAGVTIATLAAEIGAEVLTEGDADAYVERFLVGAMSGNQALRFFRRTKDAAVITGGDRSDVHTAAIEAPGVKCLILTGGHRPADAVLGKAAEHGVSVLAVTTDTRTTIDRAEAVVSEGRTSDERTVMAMRELLAEHADVDALLGSTES